MEGLSRPQKRALSPAASSSSDSDVQILQVIPAPDLPKEVTVKTEDEAEMDKIRELKRREAETQKFVDSVKRKKAQEEAEKQRKENTEKQKETTNEKETTSRMKLGRRAKDKPKDVSKDVAPRRGKEVPHKKARANDRYAEIVQNFQKAVELTSGRTETKLRQIDDKLRQIARDLKDELQSPGLPEESPASATILQCLGSLEKLKSTENLALQSPSGLIE